jgi:hypothetical protein
MVFLKTIQTTRVMEKDIGIEHIMLTGRLGGFKAKLLKLSFGETVIGLGSRDELLRSRRLDHR